MAIIEIEQATSPFSIADPGKPHPWDELKVGNQVWGAPSPQANYGYQTPLGRKFEIKGAKRTFNWQIRQAPGQQGWSTMYWGWKSPSTFTITFHMFTDDEYSQWVAFGPWGAPFQSMFMYDSTPGKTLPKAIQIYHPHLSSLGITQVLCEDISSPDKISEDKVYTAVVTLREFRQPLTIVPDLVDTTSVVDSSGPPTRADIVAAKVELRQAAQELAVAEAQASLGKRLR